jgi:DNA repair photolyase
MITKNVKVKEIQAKSILRKYKKIDSWFVSQYGMNLYRGCTHNCLYCDGRSEKYQVNGEFGKEVIVKLNAIDLLKKELDANKKRKSLKKCFIMIGGGVGDSYQPVEKKYNLTKKTLELIYEKELPISILTKSTLVKRDIKIIRKINDINRSIVSFSFSSTNDKISSIFEPGVPPPSERLKTIEYFKEHDIYCGMFLLPVIPFITDKPKIIEETIKQAKKAGVDFIIFGGMTLKDGRQKDYFLALLKKNYPNLLPEYCNIYKGDKWGHAVSEYYDSINKTFNLLAKEFKIPRRIPIHLFSDILSENDLVIVILEHIDYLLRLKGKSSPYSFAAYSISKLKEPLSEYKGSFQRIKGVGPTTEKMINEILDTKSLKYYEKLMNE